MLEQQTSNKSVYDIAEKEYRKVIEDYIVSQSMDAAKAKQIRKLAFQTDMLSRLKNTVTIDEGPNELFIRFDSFLSKEGTEEKAAENAINLIHTIARDFANYFIEIVENTEKNKSQIQRQFFSDLDSKTFNLELESIDIKNSDPHKGGKRVAFLTFKAVTTGYSFSSFGYWAHSGLQPQKYRYNLVYKPANLNVDALLTGSEGLLSRLQSVLRAENVKLPDITYQILCPDEKFGFMQCLTHEPRDYQSQTEQQYHDFSLLYGLQAAVCHCFGIDDRHTENMFVSNRVPLLLDLETAFSPSIDDSLASTLLIGTTTSALLPKVDEVMKLKKDLNSILLDAENNVLIPNKELVVAGYRRGLEFIIQHGSEFIESIKQNDTPYLVRFVPEDTKLFYSLRSGYNLALTRPTPEAQSSALEAIKQRYTTGWKENIAPEVTNFKSKLDSGTDLSQVNVAKLKYLLLIATNMDSMFEDCSRWDIPFYGIDIRTGAMYGGAGTELIWNDAKILSFFEELGYDSESSLRMLSILQDVKSPLANIEARVHAIQEEFHANHDDITQCPFYKKNVASINETINMAIEQESKFGKQHVELEAKPAKTLATTVLEIIGAVVAFAAALIFSNSE